MKHVQLQSEALPNMHQSEHGKMAFLCFLSFFFFFLFFKRSLFSLQQSTSVWSSATKYKDKTKQPFSPFLLWLFGVNSAQSNVSDAVMREPRGVNVNIHDAAFFYHIKRQRLTCGALLLMASTLRVPFPCTELPLGASVVCNRIVLFPLYLRDNGVADAASKCSCMLSAVGHLGYSSRR